MATSPNSAQYARYLLSGDHSAAGKTPPSLPPAASAMRGPGGALSTGTGAPSGEQQVSAMTAGYQDTADTCAGCAHFIADGQPCQVVADPVQSSGWCKLFSSGAGDSAEQPGAGQAPEESDQDDEDQGNGPTVDEDQQSPGPATSIPDEENES